jgi:hypothetical protein
VKTDTVYIHYFPDALEKHKTWKVLSSSATYKAASLSDRSLLLKERKLHAISTYDLRTGNQNTDMGCTGDRNQEKYCWL